MLHMSLSPCHRRTPRRSGLAYQPDSPAHAAFAITQKARPPDLIHFGATLRSLALRPGDSLTAPRSGFVDELQVLGFPHTCHPSYGGLASTPAGFIFLLNTLAFLGHTENLDTTGSAGCFVSTTAPLPSRFTHAALPQPSFGVGSGAGAVPRRSGLAVDAPFPLGSASLAGP